MRILVTGHEGYIGSVLVPMLLDRGHMVVGLDAGWFRDCDLGPLSAAVPAQTKDVRDAAAPDLEGFDAVVHLAALSNDPLSDLNPELTYDINHVRRCASPRRRRRRACRGSCSPRRAACTAVAGDALLDEQAAFSPVTPYGESKVRVEHGVAALADDGSRRPTCATPPPTASRPGCAPTSSSTTSSATRSRPARCSCRATARRGGRWCTSPTSRARSSRCSTRPSSDPQPGVQRRA